MRPTPAQLDHLHRLLAQDESWVRRARWIRYLDDGDPNDMSPIADMGRSARLAAAAWLHQQRHVLHARMVGPIRAPEGWIEDWPLTRALLRDD